VAQTPDRSAAPGIYGTYAPGGVTGAQIAMAAQSYRGRLRYVFGGAPNSGRVDCSSFVNLVLGVNLGLAIPGYKPGAYTGKSHGPVVLAYAAWAGASNVPGPPLPGDLCVWPGVGAFGHIGIAVSATEMVSALNPGSGVRQTPIQGYGPAGVPLIYRRLTGKELGGSGVAAGTAAASCGTAAAGGGPHFLGWLLWLVFALTVAVVVPRVRRWVRSRRARRGFGSGSVAVEAAGKDSRHAEV
jgi:NlpC/P60 family